MQEHWEQLMTVALLGTDRRRSAGPRQARWPTSWLTPPGRQPRSECSPRSQRAPPFGVPGWCPGRSSTKLSMPETDARPMCVPAAVERWHYITESWPILEDEWTLTLISNGWRIAPELLPAMLLRHRSDAIRRTRVMVGAGDAGRWLVGHLPDLEPRHSAVSVTPEALHSLPKLPIAPELAEMLDWPGAKVGTMLAQSIQTGSLGHSHKPMLVNLVARIHQEALTNLVDVLTGIDPMATGHGLATVLVDLASTRQRMLSELMR